MESCRAKPINTFTRELDTDEGEKMMLMMKFRDQSTTSIFKSILNILYRKQDDFDCVSGNQGLKLTGGEEHCRK